MTWFCHARIAEQLFFFSNHPNKHIQNQNTNMLQFRSSLPHFLRRDSKQSTQQINRTSSVLVMRKMQARRLSEKTSMFSKIASMWTSDIRVQCEQFLSAFPSNNKSTAELCKMGSFNSAAIHWDLWALCSYLCLWPAVYCGSWYTMCLLFQLCFLLQTHGLHPFAPVYCCLKPSNPDDYT